MPMCRSYKRNDRQQSDPDGMGAEEQETKVVSFLLTFVTVPGSCSLSLKTEILMQEGFEKAGKLRSEFVIAVTGTCGKTFRCSKRQIWQQVAMEIRAKSLRVLSESEVPPFPIEENSKTKDEVRLKYRYLDLRRPDLQRNLMLKSKVCTAVPVSSSQMKDSWRSKLRCLVRVHRKVQEIILYQSSIHPGSFYGTSAVSAALQTASDVFRI